MMAKEENFFFWQQVTDKHESDKQKGYAITQSAEVGQIKGVCHRHIGTNAEKMFTF